MRKRQYKIATPGSKDFILATYEEGELHALEGIHKLGKFWEDVCINAPIPLYEKEISRKLEQFKGLITIEAIKGSSTGEKIAMFCAAYKKHLSISYRRNYGDPKLISQIEVTPELLDQYFKNTEWWGKQPKHIRNLVKNYNALLQLKTKPKEKAITFPDEWDKQYESKLKTVQLQHYWKHLRSLGFKPEKDAMGNVLKWVKRVSILLIISLLMVGCMTPKRVQQHLAKNPQLLPAPEVDTIYEEIQLIDMDTIYLPESTIEGEWLWEWGNTTKDSTWYIPLDDEFDGKIDMSVTATDTTVITDTGHRKQTKFKVTTVIERDTIYQLDTITIERPVIKTRTVIVKQKSWTTYIPWILFITVLVALLWRRKSG